MTTETISGAMYDAMSLALKDIEAVLARHGCPKGATMTDWLDEQLTALAATAKPVDMLLLCPACGMQHIDAVETGTTLSRSGLDTLTETEVVTWSNPPHRTHMCHGCGHQWRPADVATNGVTELKTKGSNDSPRVVREAEPFAQCPHGDNEATCQACVDSSARIGRKAVGVRAVVPLSDFSVELRFYSCRQAQAFIRAAQQQTEPNFVATTKEEVDAVLDSIKKPEGEPVGDERQALADELVLQVSELPNRTSPEEDQDAMVANAEELTNCLFNALKNLGLRIVADAAQSGQREGVAEDEGTPAEILCSRLIDAWCDANGGQIPWDKAIEITAITTKLPDAERLRLLTLDDDGSAVPADRQVADLAALVKHLAHQLRKAAPDNDLAGRAVDYLKREGLQGSPMRIFAAPTQQEAAR